jgi:SAM-dependent methyltransferase
MKALGIIDHVLRREARLLKVFIQMHSSNVDIDFIKLTLRKHKGVFTRECPVCNYSGHFHAFGSPPRWDAQCPTCGSLERHRLLALLVKQKQLPREEASMLHFAPEKCIVNFLKQHARHYVTADLNRDDVDLNLNIEHIELPDDSFDYILCSHVLEHVNDLLALNELYRVLNKTGVLFVAVPIIEGCLTYENDSVVGDNEREVHFGQYDHVRYYGSDFRIRLSNAGFTCEEFTAFGAEAVRYGLLMGEKIFFCRKA